MSELPSGAGSGAATPHVAAASAGGGKWLWSNGEIREAAGASLSVWANVAHYGSGVFEGIRCYPTERGPAVFRLLDHMKRLHRSARYYGLNLRWTAEELSAATLALIRKDGCQAGYIRPLVYFGEGPIQLTPKVRCPTEALILVRPMGAYLGEENAEKGLRLTVSTWRKFHAQAVPTTAKGCGQYANSVIAAHEAFDRGYDEALLLNHDGTVAEGTGENVFFVRGGEVVTNDAASCILMGITRDSVLTLCREAGLPVTVRPFNLSELLEADEVFLTGTAAEVQLVRELDGRSYPVGEGTVASRLRRRYRDVIHGRVPEHHPWLSFAG